MNVSVNLADGSSFKKAAPQAQTSLIEEEVEQTDVDVKASDFGNDNPTRFKNYKNDPSLIMNSLIDEVAKDEENDKELTEYKKLKAQQKAFDEKYKNTKSDYEKIEEEAAAFEKDQKIEKAKKEKAERKEREKAREELQKKIEKEKKFNQKMEETLNKEVNEHFKQDGEWENFDGLDDKGQAELEELDELDKELEE